MSDINSLNLPQIAKLLERYLATLPASKQFNKLGTEPRKAMIALSDKSYSLRINTEKYFYADDSDEQKMFLEASIEDADMLSEQILVASQFDLLGPVDVAHLSALTESIRDRLD